MAVQRFRTTTGARGTTGESSDSGSQTPAPATPRPARRSQAERSAETKSRLIEATIDCLVEIGISGTTTVAVCKRAEVSHGSLLHHYGTRERLLGAALDEVYARLQGSVIESLERLPAGEARVEGLIELMWGAFGAREFKAVIELWLAAANKPDVGWAVWPEAQAFDHAIGPLAERLFPEAAHRVSDFPVYISLIFQVLQGMGLANATWPARSDPEANEEVENMRVQVRSLLSRLVRDAFKSPTE